MYKNTTHTVTIDSNGSSGEGITRIDGYTVFVPHTVKGDVCEILIVKENKNFGYGKLLKLLSPSANRTAPICPLSGKCGGCNIQEMKYEAQLEFKVNKVKDAFSRIGGFSDFTAYSAVSCPTPFGYRNKAQFPVAVSGKENRLVYGFYAPHSHRVIPCTSCALQSKISNSIVKAVSEFADINLISAYNESDGSGILRHICVRSGKNETVVILVVTKYDKRLLGIATYLTERFPEITGIVLNKNQNHSNTVYNDTDKVIFGRPYIYENIGDLKYKVHYKSFFQVNPATTKLIYEKVLSFCRGESESTLFDIYCGTGTIGLFAAKSVKKVIGIEICPEAVENAVENARINNITNARFICGKAEDEAIRLIQSGESADIVVLDPPRKGCEKSLIEAVGKMCPGKIIYVSCDCATLARDMKLFSEYGFMPRSACIFDQFPQTHHVETVVLMSRVQK